MELFNMIFSSCALISEYISIKLQTIEYGISLCNRLLKNLVHTTIRYSLCDQICKCIMALCQKKIEAIEGNSDTLKIEKLRMGNETKC